MNDKIEFLKCFNGTKLLKPVYMDLIVVSKCNEIGGTRFYVYLKSTKKAHISFSMFREKNKTTWELNQIREGKIISGMTEKGLTPDDVINQMYSTIMDSRKAVGDA